MGPDGNLWFAQYHSIGRIAADGALVEFPLPTPDGATFRITLGADGCLCFTAYYGDKIGRITP